MIYRRATSIISLLCIIVLSFIFTNQNMPTFEMNSPTLEGFKTIFLSIILEAFPFILLGVIVAALLNIFVSEDTVRRWVPRNPVWGLVFASLLGIVFPLCECGTILVIRRLVLKGMPVYMGIVYILAGPIINPVVFSSTFMAFRSTPAMASSRMILAFFVSVIIGAIIYKTVKGNPLKLNVMAMQSLVTDRHKHNHRGLLTLSHSADEFFEMGKFLMFGAMLTAGVHTFMNRGALIAIGEGEFSSHVFMMVFAFILSVCSTSDAFVAASFGSTFSTGSLLTFLVFGPMLDMKNTLMLMAVFKIRFVALLVVLIVSVTLGASLMYEYLILK